MVSQQLMKEGRESRRQGKKSVRKLVALELGLSKYIKLFSIGLIFINTEVFRYDKQYIFFKFSSPFFFLDNLKSFVFNTLS